MGTYQGNGAQFPASIQLPDDGDDNSAVVLNTGPEGNRDAVVFLHRLLFPAIANNWPYRVESDILASFTCEPVYDPIGHRWIFGAMTSVPQSIVFQSRDLGNRLYTEGLDIFGSWNQSSWPSALALGVIESGANAGRVLAFGSDGGYRWRIDPGGNWADISGGSALDMSTVRRPLFFAPLSGLVCPIGQDVWRSANDGTTWSWTFLSGTFSGVAAWKSACSPTMFVAFPTTADADDYITSTDGSTWTERTVTGVASGEVVRDLTWTGSHFIRVAVASGATKVYRSSDGINWTLLATIPEHTLTAVASLERKLLVGISNYAPATSHPAHRRMIYSSDGGTTWRTSAMRLTGTANQYLRSNGAQFLATSGACAYGSRVVGDWP